MSAAAGCSDLARLCAYATYDRDSGGSSAAGAGTQVDEDTPKTDVEAAHGGDGGKADADTACIYEQYHGLGRHTAGVRAASHDQADFASKQVDPRMREEMLQKVLWHSVCMWAMLLATGRPGTQKHDIQVR